LISTFLTNISDEFRTPLAALNACVEYLLGDFDSLSREEINELLRSIHLSVTGLSTLIENLIQSANIDAGHLLIRTGAIDLGVVVSEAIDFMRPLINRRCQQVIVEQPSSLLLVSGDPARLTQVMVNLLSNASKFGPMNQTIGVVLEDSHQNEVRVRVVDQGSGFLPEEQEKVIDFFLQPVSESNRPYGNALAIAVARKIVEEHGGTMGVEQRPGDGMNFWFTVPTVQKYRRG
jgi:K+-sensing histidine kinase KdpD